MALIKREKYWCHQEVEAMLVYLIPTRRLLEPYRCLETYFLLLLQFCKASSQLPIFVKLTHMFMSFCKTDLLMILFNFVKCLFCKALSQMPIFVKHYFNCAIIITMVILSFYILLAFIIFLNFCYVTFCQSCCCSYVPKSA